MPVSYIGDRESQRSRSHGFRDRSRMQLMNPTPSTGRASSSRIASSTWFDALKRVWAWLTLVHADDPIRRALNHGFAYVICAILSLSVLLVITVITTGSPVSEIIVNIVAP